MIFRVTRFARLEEASKTAADLKPGVWQGPGRAADERRPQSGRGETVVRQQSRQGRLRELPAEAMAQRAEICRACDRLVEDHCTHPGCPHCFRHPNLIEPWRTVRRCPDARW